MIHRILITWVLPLHSMKYIWWDAGGNHSLEFKIFLTKLLDNQTPFAARSLSAP